MNPAETYILNQPEPYKSMLLEAQVIIEQTLPDAELKYKWKLPMYYSGKCPICYLNVTKGYLDICFWVRTDFKVHLDVLISEKRKFVKSLRYLPTQQINSKLLIDCINEAYRTRGEKFTGQSQFI